MLTINNTFSSDFCDNHSHPASPAPLFLTSPRPILDVLKSVVSRPQVPSPHTRVPRSPSHFYTQPNLKQVQDLLKAFIHEPSKIFCDLQIQGFWLHLEVPDAEERFKPIKGQCSGLAVQQAV